MSKTLNPSTSTTNPLDLRGVENNPSTTNPLDLGGVENNPYTSTCWLSLQPTFVLDEFLCQGFNDYPFIKFNMQHCNWFKVS